MGIKLAVACEVQMISKLDSQFPTGTEGAKGGEHARRGTGHTASKEIRPCVTDYPYVVRDLLEDDTLTPRYELGRYFPSVMRRGIW